MAQVVKHLPTKSKAKNPSTTTKNKKVVGIKIFEKWQIILKSVSA
jgi:hypothetical protein